MNKMFSVLYFHIFSIVRSPKYVLPIAFLVFLQIMHYTTVHAPPAQFFDYIFLSEIFTFAISVWLGSASNKWFETTTEQLLILKVGSDKFYYAIYTVFLFVLSVCISLISVAIPTIYSFTGLFEQFTVTYFAYSFVLFLGSSFAGICLGSLFHPRMFTKKNEAQFLAILACIVAITRYPISQTYPILNYVLWILPNLSSHQAIITSSSELIFSNVGLLVLVSIAYGILYAIIKILLLCRKRF